MEMTSHWVIWYKRLGSDIKLYLAFDGLGNPFSMGQVRGNGTTFSRPDAETMARKFQALHPSNEVGFEPLED